MPKSCTLWLINYKVMLFWVVGKSYRSVWRAETRNVCCPSASHVWFGKLFVQETDVSGIVSGFVVMQEGRLIAFYSRLLGPRAQCKSIYEKELMAVCLSMIKWKHYLLGRRFVVRTDQQSLRSITQQTEIGTDYQKWVLGKQTYGFRLWGALQTEFL